MIFLYYVHLIPANEILIFKWYSMLYLKPANEVLMIKNNTVQAYDRFYHMRAYTNRGVHMGYM